MGCCLSTTNRNDLQSHSIPNGNNNLRELDNILILLQPHIDSISLSGDSLGGTEEGFQHWSRHSQHHVHHSRRGSRRSPSDNELRRDGLQLEERVTRPLVRHTWTAGQPMTRSELLRRRGEYYDTRVMGRPEIWAALRLAIDTMEADLATAQEIINASGITIPSGNLTNGAYDEFGTRYELPDYCVAEPKNLLREELGDLRSEDIEIVDDSDEAERKREEKGKKVIYADEEQYTVVARLSDRGGLEADVVVNFISTETVRSIIRKIMENGRVNSTQYRVRVAYLGKILRENDPLKDQGWKPGNIINALVLQRN